MNSDKLTLALDHWMALNPDERAAFERQCCPDLQLGLPMIGCADVAGVAAPKEVVPVL